MSILIQNGRVITADTDDMADVYVEGDKIALVGRDLPVQADHVINAAGRYVMPGGIDPHTHFDLPFAGIVAADDFESGTVAAAHGGTTTIVDFAVQYRGMTMQEGFENWLKKAEGKAVVDYGLHLILTELPDAWLPEMDRMVREGVTSFKLFTAYPGVYMLDDATIFKALQRTAINAGLILMHAENGGVIDLLTKKLIAEGKVTPNYHYFSRPASMEEEATHRVLKLAELAGVPVYIVHVSSHQAMEQIRAARDRGLPAYGETCPQYLWLAYEDYAGGSLEGAKLVCSPPIRERANQEPMWQALAADDLQAVATDHCPFCTADKERGRGDFTRIPNGVPGVENRMHVIYQGGVVERGWSLNRFVQVTSTAAAKLFGLYPRKGAIAVGSDADLVLWDPHRPYTIRAATHFMRVDYNPYEGRTIHGSPSHVLSRGRVVFEDDRFVGRLGAGEYLPRKTYALL